MSDDLVQALRDSKGWPTLGNAAADRIQKLEAELAYYKGVHDGIYSKGTHVVVPVNADSNIIDAMAAVIEKRPYYISEVWTAGVKAAGGQGRAGSADGRQANHLI